MNKDKDKMHINFRTVGLVLGCCILGFVVFTLYLYPILTSKKEDIIIGDENVVVGDEPEIPENNNWWIYPELGAGEIYKAPIVNWNKFWSVFKNYSLWMLEGWNPNTLEWVDATSLLTINRDYTGDNSCKIGLTFTTPDNGISTDWRFTLGIDYRVKEFINKSGDYEYTLSYEAFNASFNVVFNWSDMLQYSGLIFNHGVKNIDGDDYFWFRVRRNNVPPDFFVDIDPNYEVYSGTNIVLSVQAPRVLARQSNGTLYCTFSENNDVHIAYSDDAGVTWNDVEIWGLHTSVKPSLAVDSNDVIHLVFQSLKNDGNDNQLEYSNSTDWATIVQIRDEDKHHYNPAIAVDSLDNLHVTYEKDEEGASNDNQIAYINSTDNGATWGTEQILSNESDAADDNWRLSIAIDNNDIINLVYAIEDYDGIDAIAHMNSSDYGGTWTGYLDDIVLDTATNELYPSLAINDNNDLMVVGHDSAFDVFYRYNGSGDSGWSNGAATEEIDQNGMGATISTTSNQTTNIMFEEPNLNDIQHYVNHSDSWIDNGIVLVGDYETPTSISAQHPTIDSVKTNRPATGFAFICTNTTNTNITYFASDNLTWDTGGVVEDDTVVITLIDHSPSNIRINSTGDTWFLYNITTNSTAINNWSIVWAYSINHTETLTQNTSYSLEDPLAEDKLRAYNRNENLTQETKFNSTTGDGSIGGFGEWNTHDLNYGVTIVDSGSNWTLVNATEEVIHHLFNSIGFVDREEIVGTNHTGNTIEISKTNYAKIEFNMTDTDWYDTGHYRNTSMFLHLYVNQSSAGKPLLVYFANESYTSGQPASSPYASLIGSINPGDSFEYSEENSSYYDINFIINKTGFVGAVNVTSNFSIILRSTVPTAQKWDLYYADQNVSHTVGGVTHYHDYDNHTIMELTVNSGNTWSSNASTPDMYFNFISLNEEDVSEVKLYANDTSNNSAWSSVHTDLVDITNYPPSPADIIVPNSDTNYTVGDTIPINYNWIGDPNLDTCWVNISLWNWNTTTLDTYIINQSLTFEMVSENNSNFTYNWDTTGMSPNNYTVAINITDDEFWANSSSEVFYIWSSNAQLLSGWFSGGNVSVNAQLLSGWFSGGNVSNVAYLLDGWFSGGNLSINNQLLSGWFSGGNASSVNQQLLSGWFSGGNLSINSQLLSGWFSGGNVSDVNLQLLSGWFSGGNVSDVNQQLLSGWFSGGNTSVINITITDEYPGNGSISIPLQPTVYVTINSGDGDVMNITWYYGTASGAENIEVGTDNNITNGSYTELYYPITGRVTTYYWRVMANDGTNYINESFSFTTEGFPIAPRPPNIGLAVVGIIFGTLGLLSFVMFSKKKKKKKKVNKDMYMEEEEWLD